MSKERYENLRASNVYLKGRIKDASLLLSLKLNSEARRNFTRTRAKAKQEPEKFQESGYVKYKYYYFLLYKPNSDTERQNLCSYSIIVVVCMYIHTYLYNVQNWRRCANLRSDDDVKTVAENAR